MPERVDRRQDRRPSDRRRVARTAPPPRPGLAATFPHWAAAGSRSASAANDFAVASGFGIDAAPSSDQRLHLDAVAAPHHWKRLEFVQGIGLADFVALLLAAQSRTACLPRRPHGPPSRSAMLVFAQRVLVVSERFGEPAAQHQDRWLLFRRKADDFQIGGSAWRRRNNP